VLPGGTFEHKVSQITKLMERFPGRKFILIGDSGEKDPEIYRQVQSVFGAQVQEIIIRDLTNARQLAPGRLEGMVVVEAPTVVAGVSQFGH
jgi:phosphatidate phosphatase APP1